MKRINDMLYERRLIEDTWTGTIITDHDALVELALAIIKECATLIDAEEIQSSYGSMLKEHFGIKQ